MSIRDELAQVLGEHTLSYWSSDEPQGTRCKCGWKGAGLDLHRVDAILARFGVVELPEGEQDDDGQTYFDVGGIRVDHSGPHGAEVYVGKHSATVEWLRWHAAEYLAAARDAERQS